APPTDADSNQPAVLIVVPRNAAQHTAIAEWCAADPGPYLAQNLERSRVCSASLIALRCARKTSPGSRVHSSLGCCDVPSAKSAVLWRINGMRQRFARAIPEPRCAERKGVCRDSQRMTQTAKAQEPSMEE